MRPRPTTSDSDVSELQRCSSIPSQITTASSPEDSDELGEQWPSGLGRLSHLSAMSKFSMKLNQIHHIKICATNNETKDGATVYVLNVYLRFVQKGLPPPPGLGESEGQRKKRLRLEREMECPLYQVEHRYSEFRELRRRIMETVRARGGRYHQHCSYCSRVKFIDSSTSFPPRVPNRGLMATCTGWRQICTHFRKRQLESFVNQLLKAAKDLSYRTGRGQCERFLVVSQILSSFLSAPSMLATESVW
ncbi:hypothetical protein PPTG_16678 [Phytophthora nicotianae INRA-310]|uniref:PX domain-containing protein n=4 Tax=Phytophthora nicotianae TaxID=4792 RepID=W2PMZ7_PHYN3|nr:hypothetical protein PPTG_16678 [Phytophthora nicotianae INRA-310]ETI35597.1 hypothetical protein F443_18067 [Phytophthora nicotianae P1569]ETN02001.1 hypothetical protein PPTG_16678 [Phytophthora nicotianae INRA-310]KUF95914.1 Tartrate-resistant acid phosphatase type 5 [Phytophthora nicotianae]